MKTIRYMNADCPDTGRWKGRHTRAVELGLRAGHFVSSSEARRYANASQGCDIVQGLNAWCNYAISHKARYGTDIGCDYVLGPAWKDWGLALRRLLDGETGDLDCGTLDTIIHDNLNEQGYKEGVDW